MRKCTLTVRISFWKEGLRRFCVLGFGFWVLSIGWLEGSCWQLLGVASNAPPGQIQSRRVAYWMQSRRLRLLYCLHAVVTGNDLHRSLSPEAIYTDRCAAGQGSRRRPRNL